MSSRYVVHQQDLIEEAIAQELVCDPSFAAIADAYLGSESVQTDLGLWHSVVFGAENRSASSQLFHSDRDHLRFVKFFAYLTDVDTTNGPHVYVRGSHRRRPLPLRRDVRFDDAQILEAYPPSDVVELTGPIGTVFAVDTSGLHKGKPPSDGERWIVELEYASSLFGPGGYLLAVTRASDEFRAAVAADPRRYARFTFDAH